MWIGWCFIMNMIHFYWMAWKVVLGKFLRILLFRLSWISNLINLNSRFQHFRETKCIRRRDNGLWGKVGTLRKRNSEQRHRPQIQFWKWVIFNNCQLLDKESNNYWLLLLKKTTSLKNCQPNHTLLPRSSKPSPSCSRTNTKRSSRIS